MRKFDYKAGKGLRFTRYGGLGMVRQKNKAAPSSRGLWAFIYPHFDWFFLSGEFSQGDGRFPKKKDDDSFKKRFNKNLLKHFYYQGPVFVRFKVPGSSESETESGGWYLTNTEDLRDHLPKLFAKDVSGARETFSSDIDHTFNPETGEYDRSVKRLRDPGHEDLKRVTRNPYSLFSVDHYEVFIPAPGTLKSQRGDPANLPRGKVTEAARSPQDAWTSGLGLLYKTSGSGSSIILFDPKKCLYLLEQKRTRQTSPELDKAILALNDIKKKAWTTYRAYFERDMNIKLSRFQTKNLVRWLESLLRVVEGEENYSSHQVNATIKAQPEIWNAEVVLKLVKQAKTLMDKVNKLDPDFARDGDSLGTYFSRAFVESTVGFIAYSKYERSSCDPDTWSVSLAAAEKGWGPLIYDFALSLIHPNFLASDPREVSGKASRVWAHYFKNRPDVEHVLLSPECEVPDAVGISDLVEEIQDLQSQTAIIRRNLRQSITTKRDGWQEEVRNLQARLADLKNQEASLQKQVTTLRNSNPLSYKFRIMNPIVDFSALKANSDRFIEDLKNQYAIKADPALLRMAGEAYFEGKYNQRGD